MDESKKINAGKYRNKQRYKNKAKVVQKNPEPQNSVDTDDKIIIDDSHIFQKRSLESNWYRYEPKEESDTDTSRDFSVLASAPIAQASYFQFKSDKNIINVSDLHQIDNKLFRLDVNLLNLSISTIPFHIQCGLEEKYFSEQKISNFIKDANDNISKYNYYIETKKDDKLIDKQSGLKEISHKKVDGGEVPISHKKVDGGEVPIESKQAEISKNSASSESNDLEEWLDDILGD